MKEVFVLWALLTSPVAFALMAGSIILVGWVVLLPIIALLHDVADTKAAEAAPSTDHDPVGLLREQYLNGDLDEQKLEHLMERLLATEPEQEAQGSATKERETAS